MIISPGRRYIFVHIPKTGGTSMALALEARAMKDDMMLGDTPKAKNRRHKLKDVKTAGRLWKHSTLADIDGLIGPDALSGYFCFTLVRNPWDRVVSYYHWLQVQTFQHPAVALAQSVSFEAFVCHPETIASLKHGNARSYLTDSTGRAHEGAYIRIEHLQQDLAPLEDHLGFKLEIPWVNRSSRATDWRQYYTQKASESVFEACNEDAIRFKYTLDG